MRPTFAESERAIEAHIFDFTRDIYGTRIKLELIERIRTELKFADADALKAQIALDLGKAREILSKAQASTDF
jgi:riboflavin kinase/FMN adenylyltransferase